MNDIEEQIIPEFGVKKDNEERRDGGCAFVFDPVTQKYAVGVQDNGRLRLFSGGVDDNEDIVEGILREVVEEGGLHNFAYHEITAKAFTHYHNSLRNVNRVALATCLLVILKDADLVPVELEEHEKFELKWVTGQEMIDNFKAHNQNHDNDHWLYFYEKSVGRAIELGYDTTTKL